jgi:hypothetical protein
VLLADQFLPDAGHGARTLLTVNEAQLLGDASAVVLRG